MPRLKVSFPVSLRRSFARKAKDAFPTETIALLVGYKHAGSVNVTDLVFPIPMSADKYHICIDDLWYDIAHNDAAKDGLAVVGDLHSHCYKYPWIDASPSETDMDRTTWLHPSVAIQGICAVTEKKCGTKRARFRFWPLIEALEVTP